MKNLPLILAASFIAAILAASIALGSQYTPAHEEENHGATEEGHATEEDTDIESHAETPADH